MGKYEYCIRRPHKAPPTNHTKTDYDETMMRMAFCEEGDFPVTPVQVIVRHIKSIPPDYHPHTDMHYHDQDQLYVFSSEEEGELEAEVMLGKDVYEVRSPAVVLMPKDAPHKYAMKKGHGFVFIFQQTGTVDYLYEACGIVQQEADSVPAPCEDTEMRMMMERKYEYCVKKPYDTTSKHYAAHHTKEHHAEAMPRWSFCGDGYFPESPVRVVVRQIRWVPPDYVPHIDLHTNDMDELFIFVSEDESGLEAEVQLGDELYRVTSPVTILLPKGVPHRYAAKKGHGFLFSIVPISCAEDYNKKHTFLYKE